MDHGVPSRQARGRQSRLYSPITLSPGARLGPYEILSALGVGGPVSVRGDVGMRELRRGLAETELKKTRQ